MMSVKDTARLQYTKIANHAAQQVGDLSMPPEGWITTIRKALGISAIQIAKRLKLARASIYQAERNEREGTITINQMDKMAHAMGCKFVYAIVPEDSIEQIVTQQAKDKATATIRRASAHMALESQSVDDLPSRINQLASELRCDMPSDFWEDST